jgi:hypothetical protein
MLIAAIISARTLRICSNSNWAARQERRIVYDHIPCRAGISPRQSALPHRQSNSVCLPLFVDLSGYSAALTSQSFAEARRRLVCA